MLNLFKRRWLPDYIREYILKTFPAKHFKVEFVIGGKCVELSEVVGNERRIEYGIVTYTDAKGDSLSEASTRGRSPSAGSTTPRTTLP